MLNPLYPICNKHVISHYIVTTFIQNKGNGFQRYNVFRCINKFSPLITRNIENSKENINLVLGLRTHQLIYGTLI